MTPWLGFMAAWLVFALLLTRLDRDLLKERARPGPGACEFLMARAARPLYAFQIIAGAWHLGKDGATALHPAWQWAGLALASCGMVVTAWSMRSNLFFSSVVRIQTERDHVVVDCGPYSIVRHPGYVGLLMLIAGTALALDCPVALLALPPWVLLTLHRIRVEEDRLSTGLAGYGDYVGRVRWRLLPGLW